MYRMANVFSWYANNIPHSITKENKQNIFFKKYVKFLINKISKISPHFLAKALSSDMEKITLLLLVKVE